MMLEKIIELKPDLLMRSCCDADSEFLFTLYASTREDLRTVLPNELFDTLIKQQQHAQSMGYQRDYPTAEYYTLVHQHACIGRLVLNFTHEEIRIIDLALLPAYRNLGHGTALIAYLKSLSIQLGKCLILMVARDNTRAKKFYLKESFSVIQESAVYELMRWKCLAPCFC